VLYRVAIVKSGEAGKLHHAFASTELNELHQAQGATLS
jgi:hypothetical protein